MNIILPSMGRCGSEALFHAIQLALPDYQHNFYRSLNKVTWKDHTIVKTHDVAPKELPDNNKVIYTYGNVHLIASSVMKKDYEWKQLHFYHFHTKFISCEESLINSDGLGLRKNYRSWKQFCNVLFIHYDNLFESSELISNYLGVEVVLPEKERRLTNRITVNEW